MTSEKEWLVKTSTRILGPFTLDEVKTMLHRKHISIIDEVRLPIGRWQYVREHKVLRDVVEKMRYELDQSAENTASHTQTATATATATLQTSTALSNFTKTAEMVRTQDLTPTPVMGNTSNLSRYSSSEIKDVQPLNETKNVNTSISAHRAPGTSYGSQYDQNLQDSIHRQSQPWRLALFAVIGFLIIGIMASQWWDSQKKSRQYQALIGGILHYKTIQLYDKALQSYNSAQQVKEVPEDSKKEIAPILIAFDRQTLAGRKSLEKALAEGRVPRHEMADTHTSIGLSFLYEGDIPSAEEQFNKALGYDAHHFYALTNLALLRLKKGDLKEFNRTIEDLRPKNIESSYIYIIRSLGNIDKAKQSLDETTHRQMASDLKFMSRRTSELKTELLLLEAYHEALIKNFDAARKTVDLILEQVPRESKNYVRSPLLDWRLLEWENLERYCTDLYKLMGATYRLKAVRALCYANSNRETEASQYMNEAMKEGQNDPLILGMQLEFYNLMHRTQESEVMLRLPALDNTVARDHIQGLLCLKKPENYSCAESSFQNLKGRISRDPMPFYYLAQLSYQKNEKREAIAQIKSGFEISEKYTPLLELRDQLESEP